MRVGGPLDGRDLEEKIGPVSDAAKKFNAASKAKIADYDRGQKLISDLREHLGNLATDFQGDGHRDADTHLREIMNLGGMANAIRFKSGKIA